jgi:cytochrome P450
MSDLRAELAHFIEQPGSLPDPSRLYHRLVTESPVLDLGRAWAVSGHAEIQTVLMHPGTTMNPARIGLALPRLTTLSDVVEAMLPMRDGADHTRLRRLATVAFSARRIAAIRTQILDTVDALLAPALAVAEFDFVGEIAVPLPVAVSCGILDVPAADRGRITTWAELVTQSLVDPPASRETFEARFAEFVDYVEWLCAERSAHPGDDLVSHLAAARTAGVIDSRELLAFVVMLFANGLETLTSGLSVAAWQLLSRPDLVRLVRADPHRAEAVFDECLRLYNPVRASARALTEAVELPTGRIPARSVAILLYAAANRDPRRFDRPDELDPNRADRRHLAFGHGAHHCLGAALSQIAGAAVLRGLAAHDLATDVTTTTAAWGSAFATSTLRTLPIHRAVLAEVA